MKVIISNLPPETTKEMLLEEIQQRHIQIINIELEDSGDPEKLTAIVSLDTGHAGATSLEKRVDCMFWHGRTLRAYALKEFDNN